MKTKKGEKKRLRITILDRAIGYFKEYGSGVGVAGLMKHIGLTTGALYSHFKSKDDLFAEVICRELEKLEFDLNEIVRKERKNALKVMIEMYFDENRFKEIGDGCIYTALGTDMSRCKASYRAHFEEYTERVLQIFANCVQDQFPDETPKSCYEKAVVLHNGMVGAMTIARTVRNLKTAHAILLAEKEFQMRNFVAE